MEQPHHFRIRLRGRTVCVGKVVDHGNEICFPSGMEKMGPITQKLYETLTGIQMGHIEAPEGWLKVIE